MTDNTITITKGDSLYKTLKLVDQNGNDIVLGEDDVIRMQVKSDLDSKDYLIEKLIPVDTMLLYIAPNDTRDLKCGKYYYDIEVELSNGDVFTAIKKSRFKIDQEVTRYGY